MERLCADAAVRSWPAARFRLTAVIVSAVQMIGLVVRPGGAAAIRLRDADPEGLVVLPLAGDRSPFR